MKTSSYNEIRGKLGNLAPFKGNSMSAVLVTDGIENTYQVYSYNTIIASVRKTTSGTMEKWVTERKYSVTTSRHTNLCRAWLPGRDA